MTTTKAPATDGASRIADRDGPHPQGRGARDLGLGWGGSPAGTGNLAAQAARRAGAARLPDGPGLGGVAAPWHVRLERPSSPVQAKATCSACAGPGGEPCAKCAQGPLDLVPAHSGQARRAAPSSDPAERQADEIGARIGADLRSTGAVGAGRLPAGAQRIAERHVGVSLEGTELRSDSAARAHADAERAHAVTHGTTIDFAARQLSGDERGLALLGHELVHVAQQRAAGVDRPQRDAKEGTVGSGPGTVPDPSQETEEPSDDTDEPAPEPKPPPTPEEIKSIVEQIESILKEEGGEADFDYTTAYQKIMALWRQLGPWDDAASAHFDLWDRTSLKYPKIEWMCASIQSTFSSDVGAVALKHLAESEKLVLQEMTELGISEDDFTARSLTFAPRQDTTLSPKVQQDLQKMLDESMAQNALPLLDPLVGPPDPNSPYALSLASDKYKRIQDLAKEARRVQQALGKIRGTELAGSGVGGGKQIYFDPDNPPSEYGLDFGMALGHWRDLVPLYTRGEALLEHIGDQSPILFASIHDKRPVGEYGLQAKEGDPRTRLQVFAETSGFMSQKANAEAQLFDMLGTIRLARTRIPSSNLRLLSPIHSALLNHQAGSASGRNWKDKANAWAAKRWVAGPVQEDSILTFVLELIASVATLGIYDIIVAAEEAEKAEDKARQLRVLGRASARSDLQLAYHEQIAPAEAEAEAREFELMVTVALTALDVIPVAGEMVGAGVKASWRALRKATSGRIGSRLGSLRKKFLKELAEPELSGLASRVDRAIARGETEIAERELSQLERHLRGRQEMVSSDKELVDRLASKTGAEAADAAPADLAKEFEIAGLGGGTPIRDGDYVYEWTVPSIGPDGEPHVWRLNKDGRLCRFSGEGFCMTRLDLLQELDTAAQHRVDQLIEHRVAAPSDADVLERMLASADMPVVTDRELLAARAEAPRGGPGTAIKEGEVVEYRESTLRGRGVKGDKFTGDHIPSRAALVEAKMEEVGRELTEAEMNAIRDEGLTIVDTEAFHAAESPTYGGRNKRAQIEADAKDLGKATERDIRVKLAAHERQGTLTRAKVGSYIELYERSVLRGVFDKRESIEAMLLEFLRRAK